MPIGTRARLASGGPEMLVVDVDLESSRVLAVWGARTHEEYWFSIACLDVLGFFNMFDDEY